MRPNRYLSQRKKMNRIEMQIRSTNISDLILADSYEFENEIQNTNMLRVANIGILDESPVRFAQSKINYRIFSSPNPFLQHIFFQSTMEIEIIPPQEYLDKLDYEELFKIHNLQLNDRLKIICQNAGMQLIQVPVLDEQLSELAGELSINAFGER